MNGSKQHVVLALLLLVLSVCYTSGSVLSSSSMLVQQGQENLTQENVAQEQVQQECDEEGAASTKDCNVCYCLNGHLSCSKKICFNLGDVTSTQPPEMTTTKECNGTFAGCNGPLETDNGSQQSSTKANEDPDNQDDTDYEYPDYQEDPDNKVCVEGTKWTEKCNICECLFDQILCTMNTCLPECGDGSFWVDDCNTCECYSGEVECTNRKCLSDSATTCKEGSSWKRDCNICFCSNGIITCSKEICPAEDDDTTTELSEMTFTKEKNLTDIAGNMVIQGVAFVGDIKILKIPSELNFCSYTINGQLTYFSYVPKCYEQGKLACAYCEKKQHKFNPKTCKCHRQSRFKGRK